MRYTEITNYNLTNPYTQIEILKDINLNEENFLKNTSDIIWDILHKVQINNQLLLYSVKKERIKISTMYTYFF